MRRNFEFSLLLFVFVMVSSTIFANPIISNVQVERLYGTSVTITWTTDVESTSRVTYGTSTPPSTNEDDADMVTSHRVIITELTTCTTYYFSVTSNDGVGSTTDDNGGSYYQFKTGLDTQPEYYALDTPIIVPTEGMITSSIVITEDKEFDDIEVHLNNVLLYEIFNLKLFLITPDNKRVPLSLFNGYWEESNYTNTILDDESNAYIGDSNTHAPFTGRFKPNGQLSHIYGMSTYGTWMLEATNVSDLYSGSLEDWGLKFSLPYQYCEPHAKIVNHQITDECTGIGNGNNNEVIDAGEDIKIQFTILNNGNQGLTNVTGTLSTTTEGIIITDNSATFPDITIGSQGTSASGDLSFNVNVNKSCNAEISLNLHLSSDEKPSGWDETLKLYVGDTPINSGTILKEDFTFGIPTSWTVVDGGTGGTPAETWKPFNPCAPDPELQRDPPMNEPYAVIDSDCAGPDATQDEELITPILDLSHASSVKLFFDEGFYFWDGGDYGDVDLKSSLTSGIWTNVYQDNEERCFYNCEGPVELDISQYSAGASDVQIRFHYYGGNYDFGWWVDNVKVEWTKETSCLMDRCCPSMTTPQLTITDDDLCSQTGITIEFTTSTPSTRHDFYVDGNLVTGDVTSPIHYNPNDSSEHSYKIKAINYYEDCYIESTVSQFSDEAKTPPKPSQPTVQDLYPCETSTIAISWSSVQYATNYDLLVDGQTTIQNVTSPYNYNPNGTASHTYQIRGRNVINQDVTCTGEWSNTTSFADGNEKPATPTSAPTVSDVSACATSGVSISWGTLDKATAYDLRVDSSDSKIVPNVTSPYTYSPGDNNSHTYQIRGKNGTCTGDWGPTASGTDVNDTPGAPAITAITDLDPCVTSGITITYTVGTGATSHDLYKDGSIAVSGYSSGATYQPGDTTSHSYKIRAKKNTCYTDSTPVSGTDVNDKPGAPTITAITDVSACATTGIKVAYTAGSGATSHDLYKDGSIAVSGYSSGATYQPGDNNSHSYVIRAKKNTCYTDSTAVSGTDVNDTPGQPAITSITDNDACATSGITINYTAGSGATSHDLYKDGTLVKSNFTSGSTYSPSDNNSHTYVIRAKKNTCYTDSTGVSGTDQNLKPATPSAPSLSDLDACSTSGVQISWGSVSQATGYDLRVDSSTVVSDVTSPYTYYPNNNDSHTYQVRGKNATCTGDWSGGTSGTDQNILPPPPSAPTVDDLDLCSTSGISISWGSVANATSYDLRVDGTTIIVGVTSPYTYQPNDNGSHSYEIRGLNASCTGDWSTATNATDGDSKPDTPVITSVSDIDVCQSDGVSIVWDNVSQAIGYDLLVDGATTVQDVTSPYTYTPSDSNPHTFQVRGKNANCTGEWSIVTSYNNSGGTGDRTSLITVSANCLNGTVSQLVDGNTSSSNVYFPGGSVTGKYIAFDFGSGNTRVINEAKMYQTSTATHGIWKWQGSNDGISWTDIGGPFTLGGLSIPTLTSLMNNVTLYRYYRLYGVSGTSNSGPYIYEFEFKINSQIVGVSGTDGNDTPGVPEITSITDVNECAESGIKIYFNSGSGATSHDLYKDGSFVVTGYTSGTTYRPYDNSPHDYFIRARKGSCYADSSTWNFTDQATTVGEPAITSIVDESLCAQSGIRVYYTPGSNATRHDLYRDSSRVVQGYSSGALYNPGDTNSHSYYIRAVNGSCYNNSTTQNFTDANNSVSTPAISSVTDIDGCATSGVSISWGAVSGATGYDLRVDGTTVVNNVTSPYTYTPGDNNSHNYEIRAKNDFCTSSWSTAFAGTDFNGTPAAISLNATNYDSSCGIKIEFTGGDGANYFDLYVDLAQKATHISSGYIYVPSNGDTSSHNYVVKGIYGSCVRESNSVSVADPDCAVPPPEVAVGTNFIWSATQSTQTFSWTAEPTASGYRIYRGTKTNLADLCNTNSDFCTRSDQTGTSLNITSDSPQTADPTNKIFFYLITGYNAGGEGTAGSTSSCGTRQINSTGNCS